MRGPAVSGENAGVMPTPTWRPMTDVPPPPPSPEAGMSLGMRWLFGLLVVVAASVIGMFLLNPLGTASWDPRMRVLGHAPFRVASASMAPTLVPGDIVLVSALTPHQRALAVGDVVAFRPPSMPSEVFIARIAGLAGDRVRIEAGRTWVNDLPLDEPYLNEQALRRPESQTLDEISVPPGSLFVLGDNRDNALDSRRWGFAERTQVVGRLELTLHSAPSSANGGRRN